MSKEPEEVPVSHDNPDFDIIYVDEHGRCWRHMGGGEFDEINIATLTLKPVLFAIPGEYYVDGAAKGIRGLCRVVGHTLLPKPPKIIRWY